MLVSPESAEEFARVPVSYSAVGASADPHLLRFPPRGFSPLERKVRIGFGEARWNFAVSELMTWRVKTGAGFRLTRVPAPDGPIEGMPGAEQLFDADGEPYAMPGETVIVSVGWGPATVLEPVRVIYAIDEPDRRGFAYGTLPGHPLSGEEAFFVERRPDGGIWFTVRSFSRPGNAGWRLLSPLLWFVRRIVVGRYADVLGRKL